ncbi:hypothetical protein BO82DRAFT_349693 [Aspergillus uvarum CBS 121591]|uniref:Secreted protein n=1 Tax=Aspergillus uvarum CBS 121591 TaxID=1448315 RepID=A0A319D856_9EURO|nr:hypothetical protein BO82DRAFT_349693 [Aspergillus uvarum CBS 121591]PYH87173.1 hypothetical protein BO82DRAFT_349693 [Aspergillus uvarum CBS 121591]
MTGRCKLVKLVCITVLCVDWGYGSTEHALRGLLHQTAWLNMDRSVPTSPSPVPRSESSKHHDHHESDDDDLHSDHDQSPAGSDEMRRKTVPKSLSLTLRPGSLLTPFLSQGGDVDASI